MAKRIVWQTHAPILALKWKIIGGSMCDSAIRENRGIFSESKVTQSSLNDLTEAQLDLYAAEAFYSARKKTKLQCTILLKYVVMYI